MPAAGRYGKMLDPCFDENEKLVAAPILPGEGSVCYLVLCESLERIRGRVSTPQQIRFFCGDVNRYPDSRPNHFVNSSAVAVTDR